MSLRWAEETRIFASPSWTRFARLPRGWQMRAVEGGALRAEGKPLGGLAGNIAAKQRVRLYLSGHYARLVLLPWQEHLAGEEEWEAYARLAFDAALGNGKTRRIRVVRQAYGAPVLAAAIDDAVHDELDAALHRTGASVRSAEPYCTAVFDRYRRRIPRDGWLVVAEPDIAVVMLFRGGVLHSLAMQPLETESAESLMAVIARELAKHGMEDLPDEIYVHAAMPLKLPAEALSRSTVHMLAGGRDDALGLGG